MQGGQQQPYGQSSTMPRFSGGMMGGSQGNTYIPQGYRPGFQSQPPQAGGAYNPQGFRPQGYGGMATGGGYQPPAMRPTSYGGYQNGGGFQGNGNPYMQPLERSGAMGGGMSGNAFTPGGFEQNNRGIYSGAGGYQGNGYTPGALEGGGGPQQMQPVGTGGLSPNLSGPAQTPPPQTGGPSPFQPNATLPSSNANSDQAWQQWLGQNQSRFGGQSQVNLLDYGSFDPQTGAWNGPPLPGTSFSGSSDVRGDGFTGIRDNVFMRNGVPLIGMLHGWNDPNSAGYVDAMKNLRTQGFMANLPGGSGAGMFGPGPASTPAAAPPPSNPATRPPGTPGVPGTGPGNPTHGLPTGGAPTYPGAGARGLLGGTAANQFGPIGPGMYPGTPGYRPPMGLGSNLGQFGSSGLPSGFANLSPDLLQSLLSRK